MWSESSNRLNLTDSVRYSEFWGIVKQKFIEMKNFVYHQIIEFYSLALALYSFYFWCLKILKITKIISWLLHYVYFELKTVNFLTIVSGTGILS